MKSPTSSIVVRWRKTVSEHILKMSGLHNRLSQLEINLPEEAVIDRILQSLPPSYKSFVMNYICRGW